MTATPAADRGMLLGYARAGAGPNSLAAQIDALAEVGIEPARIYSDNTVGPSTHTDRPGLTALLAYARPGDTAVVVGIDRLGRTRPEALSTARDLTSRRIGLRSLREGLDTDRPAGAMIVGVLASLAELDDEGAQEPPGGSTRTESAVGRPRALDDGQVETAERLRAAGHRVPEIAVELGVSRATVYRSLAERRAAR